jgi:protein-tyrosine phosphatase
MAAVVAAIAHARPGGVVVHCVGGRDRTGLVSLLLLALVGVAPEHIVADYALTPDAWDGAGEVILALLAELDAEAYLRTAGLTQSDTEALRERLLAPVAAAD